MSFRYARLTNDLKPLVHFYTTVIGLSVLGHFEDHEGYDGVILGFMDADWHLEFTTSTARVNTRFDEDDHLVFYVLSEAIAEAIMRDALKANFRAITPKNPYWQQHGKALRDPDGHTVIISFSQRALDAQQHFSIASRQKGIHHWDDLIRYVRQIPYGRNTSRTAFEEIFSENKGTCSTKHAFLKSVADENGIPQVQLMCGIYRMTESNTPGIGNTLANHHMDSIPEAHCYLLMHGKRLDVTFPNSDITCIQQDFMTEIEIEPHQVGDFKVQFHKNYLKSWLARQMPGRTFDEIWQIREECILALSASFSPPSLRQ